MATGDDHQVHRSVAEKQEICKVLDELLQRVNRESFNLPGIGLFKPRTLKLSERDITQLEVSGQITFRFREVDAADNELLDTEISRELNGHTVCGFQLLFAMTSEPSVLT